MSIKYSVIKNNFKKGAFYGSVLSNGDLTLKEILSQTEAIQANYSIDELAELIELKVCESLCDGYSVKLGEIITINPVMKGDFNGSEDTFDPERHKLEFSAITEDINKKLQEQLKIKFKKIDSIRRN